MTRTLRVALIVVSVLVSLVELYARSTDDPGDDEAASALRKALDEVRSILL